MTKGRKFDLYGTLVDIRTDESAKALWEQLALYSLGAGKLRALARVDESALFFDSKRTFVPCFS